MNLFGNAWGKIENLLPFDGLVEYYGCVLEPAKADIFFRNLLRDVAWRYDEVVLFGKKIVTRREVAWYGDRPFRYSYSNTAKVALPWIGDLPQLKALCEEHSGETYNSCLVNLYHDGSEGMAWHADNEKDLKPGGAIASLTLGAERRFSFKHKQSGEIRSVLLEHGSLLVMKGETQTHWLHRLPPANGICSPRINLTFRTIADQ